MEVSHNLPVGQVDLRIGSPNSSGDLKLSLRKESDVLQASFNTSRSLGESRTKYAFPVRGITGVI